MQIAAHCNRAQFDALIGTGYPPALAFSGFCSKTWADVGNPSADYSQYACK